MLVISWKNFHLKIRIKQKIRALLNIECKLFKDFQVDVKLLETHLIKLIESLSHFFMAKWIIGILQNPFFNFYLVKSEPFLPSISFMIKWNVHLLILVHLNKPIFQSRTNFHIKDEVLFYA